MTAFLFKLGILVFNYTKVAQTWRDQIRHNAEQIAAEHGINIEFVRQKIFLKDKRIKQIINQWGDHPGLVHIFSAIETCYAYRLCYDNIYRKAYLKGTTSKCLHYYFYFTDEQLGLCYVRVPTWYPFRLQIYFNGHSSLASQLANRDIEFALAQNAFVHISDFDITNQLCQMMLVDKLYQKFDR